ncbi:MAG: 50S ribosomal protein L19 [Candidatus Giovannonibacteria bacterium GW2011_GWA2_45_21]|uniref:Large ribosomal subunit protein bL19 n=1 Tax=Candidatus Giovannonibacteria bacterium GW2011_GWA2_45_21 TaxID=1618649 RepID=A0A0G1PGK1_9BACT|nr:MAG: 50S ribosomal protein L19 [Candidatus Giovannonibacteria bacterium GW2011_GWA2_45_21]
MTTIEKNTLRTDIPEIKSGDSIRVIQKVKEGDKERLSPFEGLISKIEVLRHSKVRRAKLYYIREKAAKETRKRMRSYLAVAAPESAEPEKEG